MKKSILLKAYEIVEKRSEEKSRQYGNFSEGMKRTAAIASILSNKNLDAKDIFYCMIALKLSRESFFHKEDNCLDCVAYIGAMNDYINSELKQKKHGQKNTRRSSKKRSK